MKNTHALLKRLNSLLEQVNQRQEQAEITTVLYMPVKDHEPAVASEKAYGSCLVRFYVPEHRLNEGHQQYELNRLTETFDAYRC